MPERDYSALKVILRLPDERIEELYSALESTPPKLHARELVSEVAPKTKIDRGDLNDIIRFLLTIYRARTESEGSESEYVPFIRDFFIEELKANAEYDELKPAQDSWDTFDARVERLLSFEQPLGMVDKALGLWIDHENTVHEVQIVTDLRPLFKSDPEQQPGAAMIVHRLRISYHKPGSDDVEEFFIAMDSDDIDRFRAILDRAEKKATSLKSMLKSASVPLVEG